MTSYQDALRETRAPLPDIAGPRELVRYATLAANSHNTQPWRFRVEPSRIDILPDFARRTAVVDPDDHHLFVSLGCAAETLAVAAAARGWRATIAFEPDGDGSIRVDLDESRLRDSPLFEAIALRQCSRADYNGRALDRETLRTLELAARIEGVELLIATGRRQAEQALESIVAANSAQMDDRAFMAELKSWIRFSAAEAAATRDGLYSAASGNPSLPRWLGNVLFDRFVTKPRENEKIARHVRSSAGLVVFVGADNNKEHWMQAGRACQRFALAATTLGVRHAFLNQPVEVSAVRRQFASLLGLGTRRPDLVVRFGYGPEMPRSLRRKVEEVIV
jgi:hypothetical protein